VGQGDEVPTAPVTVAVALADKLDNLFGFFGAKEKPTGSKDPFALRRAGLGVLSIIQQNDLRIDAKEVFTEIASVFIVRNAFARGWRPSSAAKNARDKIGEENFKAARTLAAEMTLFLRDRLVQQQRDQGIRPDLVASGFGGLGRVNDFISLLARVKALQDFVETGEGADLLTAYKRAANILKKEKWEGQAASGPRREPVLAQEQALIDALDAAEPRASKAVETEDFIGAMEALASLRSPIDSFFDSVTVNVEDSGTRAERLNLLMRFRDAVHRVADFSKIEASDYSRRSGTPSRSRSRSSIGALRRVSRSRLSGTPSRSRSLIAARAVNRVRATPSRALPIRARARGGAPRSPRARAPLSR
jgi:glycyl-tRNA synthetase beta chain